MEPRPSPFFPLSSRAVLLIGALVLLWLVLAGLLVLHVEVDRSAEVPALESSAVQEPAPGGRTAGPVRQVTGSPALVRGEPAIHTAPRLGGMLFCGMALPTAIGDFRMPPIHPIASASPLR